MSTYDSSLFAKLENNTGYNKTNESRILNPYVNWNNYSNVQTLADSLVAESVQMRGIELYYIPRQYVNPDIIFGEDTESKFDKAWQFAGYLDSFEGYSGDNTYFSKFGMMVNDEVTITINPNLFKHQTNGTEPKAGDLIYFKMDNSLFEINWVQPYDPFYQLGQNAMRKITATKFIYSGEELKPELQRNEGIVIPEFSELDLMPIHNIDSLADINDEQYEESKAFNIEAGKYVEPFVVLNGKGLDAPPKSPFDDDFMS
ncbi:head closure Hc2 [Pectobacterium bacteriophage PM2]|uniref:Head completion, neck hetero-dimeric protein n=1 Tax=Pectobacterium bacteriophage PM2 TaxID=1429794 RepID=A0A0A0Q0J4_9CAUD|nr:head closure Hc2 [Pectobacterium bacteriophage PM2]AHY25146.1 head completion, neck hetero-dimeric protein [Pectobacterium bacteriophage PM2]